MYGAGQGKNQRYYQRFTYWHLEKSQISERKFQQSEVVVLQQPLSFRQSRRMQNRYPNGLWEEILAACDTSLFLGCNDETSAKYYSEKSGISTIEVGTEQRILKNASNHGLHTRSTSIRGRRKALRE